MAALVLSRLGLLVLSLALASVLVFLAVNVLPGDPAAVILGTSATPELVRQLHAELGLDRPGWQRYLEWLGGLVTGNLGISVISKEPIGPELVRRLSVSAPLASLGTLVALLIGLPLGVAAGVRQGRLSGTVISGLSLIGLSVPAFWAGLLLITVFAIRLRLLPAGDFVPWTDDPAAALRSLILPAIALGLVQGAVLTRFVRSAVIEVRREDFIRTARAKGLTRWQALSRHGFRNAAIPVVTVLGIQLTSLIVGAIVIENVFVLPGLGVMLFAAVQNRDLIEIQDLVMLLTAVVLVVNMFTDVSYRLLDPRIRAAR
ncbi:MAG: ABC transporter permease [Candidatus Dormibacteraeota bacterium]|nr:ABC transporter permease [Candidatus Dormibacteraeota bacterium]